MRDVSHESRGAAVLGLTAHTENMLRRFAHSVAASRKWCGFLTITADGFPSPDTYRDDTDFGYCLPANFDLVRARYQQLRSTGNRAYLDACLLQLLRSHRYELRFFMGQGAQRMDESHARVSAGSRIL